MSVLAGCGETRSALKYFFSFGHVSQDAPPVDVYIDDVLVFEDLAPGDITGYMRFQARPFDITYRIAGTNQILSGPVPPAPVPSGGQQTVLLIGSVADQTIDLLRWNHKQGNGNKQRNRFLVAHGAFDVEEVDLLVNGDLGGRNVKYLESSRVSGAKKFPVQLMVRRTEGQLKLTRWRSYDLDRGRDYSVVLLGMLDQGTIDILLLQDDTGAIATQASRARFVHAVASFPDSFEIRLDGFVAEDRVRYGRSEKYTPILPGTYRLTVYDKATETELADLGDLTLAAADNITLILGERTPGSGDITAVRIDDGTGPAEEFLGQIRFLNAAADSGPLDLYVDDLLIAEGIRPGAVSEYTAFDSGTSTFRVEDPASGAVLTQTNFRIRQGEDFTFTTIGVLGGEPEFELVRLEDDLEP